MCVSALAVDPSGGGGEAKCKERGGEGSPAIGANVDDRTSLRILADIPGYRLEYLRGQCSRGKIGEILGEA